MVDIDCGNHKTLCGAVLSGADGDDNTYCTLCKVQFSVVHGGANDVCRHLEWHHICQVCCPGRQVAFLTLVLAIAQRLELPGYKLRR